MLVVDHSISNWILSRNFKSSLTLFFAPHRHHPTALVLHLIHCARTGALLFTPAMNALMERWATMPEYIGSANDVQVINQDGKYFVQDTATESLREVVIATANDISLLSGKAADLAAGVYAVDTGSTGASAALIALGAGYLGTMLASAATLRAPQQQVVSVSMSLCVNMTRGIGCCVMCGMSMHPIWVLGYRLEQDWAHEHSRTPEGVSISHCFQRKTIIDA